MGSQVSKIAGLISFFESACSKWGEK